MKKTEAISILATSVRPREPKDRARYDEAVKMAIEALKCSETPKSSERTAETAQNVKDGDSVFRQAAIDCVTYDVEHTIECLKALPPAQPETCEGCKHLGKWENEVEYGYPSPCTRCKRRVGDHYESYRRITKIMIPVTKKDLEVAGERYRINAVQSCKALAMVTLWSAFGFGGRKRLPKFADEFERNTDAFFEGYLTWQDVLDTLETERGYKMELSDDLVMRR